MSMTPGTRLGPYEIVAPLGAGGMGEVYRARDTRLGRDVAIKTLPAAFAADPERRARFETEAKAVAALSHPNVLALHDIGAEGDVVFAVMEHVEGQTLRERLTEGAMASTRAVPIAIQIAHGLSAAHDRGVIHRDLKPENVMITPDGRAKILDFGLARREAPASTGSQSLAPTLAAGTEAGMVLGTTGYMSPEQVRGQIADARSDLWALGVVLYEMLSGRRAFHAGSPADTMSAILREDPPELTTLVTGLSPALERIVKRCLEKQPAARFRSAADLAFALEAVSSSGAGGAPASPAQGRLSSVPRLAFQRLTFRNGRVASARFTPDGASVVYGAGWEGRPCEIFTSRTGSPQSRSLGLPAGNVLSMSPAGELAVSLGYHNHHWFQVTGSLARVSLSGGGVRPLQKDVADADWSPDGKSMAVLRYRGGRCVLEYPAGQVRVETTGWLSAARVSRDGRSVAFGWHPYAGDNGGELRVLLASGEQRVLASGLTSLSGIAWSPSREEVLWSGIDAHQHHGIWAADLEGRQRELVLSPTRLALHDVDRAGRALVTLEDVRIGLSAGTKDGEQEVNLSWFDGSVANQFSADGRRILFTEVHEAENPHYACYLRDTDGSPAVRLGEGLGTSLSADGEWVVSILARPEHGLMLYPTGFGEPRSIALRGLEFVGWAGFHPDGTQLLAVASRGGQLRRPFLIPLGEGEPRPLPQWDEEVDFDWLSGVAIAPEGDRIVLRRLSGEHAIYSCGPGSAAPLPGIRVGEIVLRFDDTGDGLFLVVGSPVERRLERFDLRTGAREPWGSLRPVDRTGLVYLSKPVLTADGSRYAYSFIRHVSDLYVVEGLTEAAS